MDGFGTDPPKALAGPLKVKKQSTMENGWMKG